MEDLPNFHFMLLYEIHIQSFGHVFIENLSFSILIFVKYNIHMVDSKKQQEYKNKKETTKTKHMVHRPSNNFVFLHPDLQKNMFPGCSHIFLGFVDAFLV